MRRMRCIFCGGIILKSGFLDPCLCRECENSDNELRKTIRYGYLDA